MSSSTSQGVQAPMAPPHDFSPSSSLPKLQTAYGHFLLPSPTGAPAPSLLLRGVNLSSASKLPTFAKEISSAKGTREERDTARLEELGWRSGIDGKEGWWDEAENGGREGWFVGRPVNEEEADTHFERLRSWGFTAIRWVVPWEAIEHAGPGKYDEPYIEYTIRLMRKAKAYGFRVYISTHQDVFSRFTGGSGAPYWAIQACGMNPRRIHQTGAAVLLSQWEKEGSGGEEGRKAAEKGEQGSYPDMIWNSNTGRMASRHCFTMFWASGIFAPKCKIDGEPVGEYLRRHHVAAYAYLAKRISEAGDLLDSCLIGWDSVNEPNEGFIEIPDLNKIPEAQDFRKGPSPSPIQGFQLGIGQSVSGIEDADFTSTGLKKKGTVTITPPGGEGVWLTRSEAEEASKRWGWNWSEEWDFWEGGMGGCIWAGHGVWDANSGKVLRKDHFCKKAEGGEYGFIDDFWKPAYIQYVKAIRQYHPEAITLINPPIFDSPPNLGSNTLGDRAALSCHYYDGLTMMGKRRHLFNADAVSIKRGLKSVIRAVTAGDGNIRNNFRDQVQELSSDAGKKDGMAGEEEYQVWPTIIGEMGTPWDMKEDNALLGLTIGKNHRADYYEPSKAMDQLLDGCDGPKALSYTLWAYEPLNTHEHGDGWNHENLSLFSYADLKGDDDLAASNPKDLSSLIMLGSRGLKSWCRPYPLETTGEITKFKFHMSTGKFELSLRIPALKYNPLVNGTPGGDIMGYTKIYIPYAHYLAPSPPSAVDPDSKIHRIIGESDEGKEWVQGRGEAKVDLEVKLSDGTTLDVKGQWGMWRYPVHLEKETEVKLVIKPWKAV